VNPSMTPQLPDSARCPRRQQRAMGEQRIAGVAAFA
jgi:hypothetical protein